MESVDLLLTCHPSLGIITSFIFRLSEVCRLLLDLIPYGGTNPLGMCNIFLKKTDDVLSPTLVLCFDILFVWVVSLLAGDRPLSTKFRMIHSLLLLLISDLFPCHQYCLKCLGICCRFVSDELSNSLVCFQPSSLLIEKVWVQCVSHTLLS